MNFNFDYIIDRSKLNSHKWASMTNKVDSINEDIVPFTVADYDFEMLDSIKKALKNAVDTMPMGYTYPSNGYFDSIISFYQRHYGFEIAKEWILDSTGVVASIDEMIKVFTEEKEEVLVFTPVYTPFMSTIEKNSRKCIKFELTQEDNTYSIDFDSLAKMIEEHSIRMLIMCSPHNPVGRVWNKEELENIAQLCLDNNIIVVSDEIHCQIVNPMFKHTMMATLDDKFARNTITLVSPTKIFNLAGLQVSQIIVKDKLKAKIIEYRKKTPFHGLSVLSYVACQAAYDTGDAYIEQFNLYICSNYEFIKEFLTKSNSNIRLTTLEGTYLIWLNFSQLGIDEEILKMSLEKEAQLYFNQGKVYGTTQGIFFRMNIAYPVHIIEKALIRLMKWEQSILVSRETPQ